MKKLIKEWQHGGSEDGFTLVELMVALVIFGILTAIAVPVFQNYARGSVAKGVITDVKATQVNVATALVKKPAAVSITANSASGVSERVTGTAGSGNPFNIVKSDPKTAISVTGDWSRYYIAGSHPGLSGTVTFDSKGKTLTMTGNYQ